MSGETRATPPAPGAPLAGRTERGSRRATPAADGPNARENAPSARASALVVKLGGRALEAPGALRELAASLARLSRVTLLVHGGGAEVSVWCERLGLPARFSDGLRVTDAPTLEVVTAVLAGLANKRLVAALRAQGLDAVGLSAVDGGTLRVRAHARAATLGAVGEVESVDASLLATLLADGRLPVLASLAATRDGALLNVNADDAAAAIAGAIGARDLVLLSDTPGLRLGGDVVPSLRAPALDEALAAAEVGGGMVPKLRAARAALAAGVARVHIGAWSGPDSLAAALVGGSGTTLVAGDPATTLEDSHA